ncbi:hypothetical protein ZWY2020_053907 [Hordeum vulgare]|nr:hypothetical protein ZWY2020_053907 [Hordeum vulgare]
MAFVVSGLVHELMFYPTGEDMVRLPTGEATAFFALHGACAVAEAWWARHQGWWRPPRLVATPSTASPHRMCKARQPQHHALELPVSGAWAAVICRPELVARP